MLRLSYQPPEGAMAPQGEAGFPATLSTWVRGIVGAIPGPARSTVAQPLAAATGGGCEARRCTWVRESGGAIPGPARSPIAELLVGAMLGGGGHVARALLAVTPRRGWQAYPWVLGRGRLPGPRPGSGG